MAGPIDKRVLARVWVDAVAAVMLTGFRQATVPSTVYQNEHGEIYLSASSGRCRDAELQLSSDLGSAARSHRILGERACPGAERFVPRQHIVIEGLDRHGTASPGDARTFSVAVPVNRKLSRLRWYSITTDLRFRQLGDRRWRPK